MELTLLKGNFSASEAEELITRLIDVKIKFHENKINHQHENEEDIKMREKRIIQLQKDLADARTYLRKQSGYINLNAEIKL